MWPSWLPTLDSFRRQSPGRATDGGLIPSVVHASSTQPRVQPGCRRLRAKGGLRGGGRPSRTWAALTGALVIFGVTLASMRLSVLIRTAPTAAFCTLLAPRVSLGSAILSGFDQFAVGDNHLLSLVPQLTRHNYATIDDGTLIVQPGALLRPFRLPLPAPALHPHPPLHEQLRQL
jgi:hypothetical protein